jgi:acetyltransferase EpsM
MSSAPSRVVIVGAGSFGIEVAEIVEAASLHGGPPLAGFLDDDAAAVSRDLPAPVLGMVGTAHVGPGDGVVIAAGDPQTRRLLRGKFDPSVRWWTVIHPTASVSGRAMLGPGCIVAPFAYVGPAAHVGAHVLLNIYSGVGHDVVIGNFAVLSPYATMNGQSVVGEGAFLGSGSVLSVGTRLGDWSRLAAGAIAFDDIAPHSLAAGNPARGRTMVAAPQTRRGS